MEKEKVQKVGASKLRLTPLNIITAMALIASIYFVYKGFGNKMYHGLNVLFFGLSLLGTLVSFISDLIFRKMIPSLKNLWIVEGAFLVFTIVLLLIIKIVLF
ncbi:hypothetical protein [Pedobacter sp.]|uniref:hypothetical protein n=1 Tax=Pedobacter sp. TaxID=1411316 RepID=UPI003D7F51F9